MDALKQQRCDSAADGAADPHEPRRSEEHEQLYDHLMRLCFSHAKLGQKNQLMLLLLVRSNIFYKVKLVLYYA